MAAIAVGQSAPSFRLPSAQGQEIGPEDFRGKSPVIVWFTKGMACAFCRSHMSQLARGYPEFRKLGGEILEVTVSPFERARVYAEKFKIPFPYLCDPDRQVRSQWGLARREHGIGYYAKALVMGTMAPKPPNDYGNFAPPMAEMGALLADDDMGFFIVDKEGVVRYSLGGPYVDGKSIRPIPSNEEIVRELERLS
jgi:peroxiredoxin